MEKHAPVLKKATFMGMLIVVGGSSERLESLLSGFIVANLGYNRVFHIAIGIYILIGLLTIILLGDMKYNNSKVLSVKSNHTLRPGANIDVYFPCVL